MRKLCERPGCGAPAEVSYGIDNASLTVWVDNRAIHEREHAGRLCRRHADALVVPRGWTIDDRRQAIPQLFKVDTEQPKTRAPRKSPADTKPQTKREKRDDGPSLFETIEAELDEIEKAKSDGRDVEPVQPQTTAIDPDETQAIPWSPRLVAVDDNDEDEEQPTYGRLLGRAFGKKNQS